MASLQHAAASVLLGACVSKHASEAPKAQRAHLTAAVSRFLPLKSQRRAAPGAAVVCAASVGLEKGEVGGPILVDHYKRLGIAPDATNADIVKAFEERCLELTKSAEGLDEETARQRLLDLEVSLDVLTSEEARRLYDWGITRAQRGEADDYVWPFETDVTQRNYVPGLGTPPRPMTPVDDEGIATLGYVLLAFFLLSCVLSVTLY